MVNNLEYYSWTFYNNLEISWNQDQSYNIWTVLTTYTITNRICIPLCILYSFPIPRNERNTSESKTTGSYHQSNTILVSHGYLYWFVNVKVIGIKIKNVQTESLRRLKKDNFNDDGDLLFDSRITNLWNEETYFDFLFLVNLEPSMNNQST